MIHRGPHATASRPPHDARLHGRWDVPAGVTVGETVELAGWAVSRRSRQTPVVEVICDGVVLAELRPSEQRPGVLQDLGLPEKGQVGWRFTFTPEPADVGALLELVVHDSHERVSLGSIRVAMSPPPPTRGLLDLPTDGAVARAGGTLRVAGWVLFDDQPADWVELYIANEAPVPIRMSLPRPDVSSAVANPAALACGFSDLVAIPRVWAGRELDVTVVARSLAGEEWVSHSVRVTVERAEPFGTYDDGSPIDWASVLTSVTRPGASGRRLCVFTHSLHLGGGELYLQELVLRLARDHGFEILVVSPLDGRLKDELRAAGIGVHLTNYVYEPSRYDSSVRELSGIIAAWGADAVLVNTLGVFPAVDAATSLGVPTFWAVHESFSLETFEYLNWGEAGLHPAVHDRWIRCLQTASIVFESHATLEMFRAQVPGLDGRVVHYGINIGQVHDYRAANDRDRQRRRLGFSPDELVLLCMGIIQERKAQLGLVLAFAEVARTHPQARLVLVGFHDTEYARSVRTLVEALGLQHCVRIEPIQADTYLWYFIADVLVSASDTESLPRSVLEAMTFGTPTLAVDVFGLSEVVHDGDNGWLCRPHSRTSLIAGLRRVLDCSPEEREQLSLRGQKDSVAFDGSNYAAEYTELIDAAVRGRLDVNAPPNPERDVIDAVH